MCHVGGTEGRGMEKVTCRGERWAVPSLLDTGRVWVYCKFDGKLPANFE